MAGVSGFGTADLLTRTTLQIDGSPSGASIAKVVSALQRVPGVLLAEANAGTARAIVAHDSGVSTASLVAAAFRAGVRADVVAPRVAVPEQSVPKGPPIYGLLLTAGGALLVTFGLAGVATKYSPGNPWVMPVLLAACFVFCATAFGDRRGR
jgi:cation transport ATPase